ncbi:BEM46-like protein, putative [Plasmodium berghei]|uniref:BEM46-like protein, putative n=2 Tax=Plasmodium berghei TaxID=5821 RepID=A0A509AMR7_PLABA|nr:BEM46-like protein, putative [Plasmodium berghei ANKA]CXI25212.1 BEM46-like protein, putative [Plasmodium berghei]SCM20364.1 BEM46-like protein, putative [Plasmodium berghei]SCN23964.1 BEM46-like protein, putative [Plasmodium berghei]SCO59330.1 BEM46-like protein, putative [Plasmodium berghei]SCO60412.1 BEM46-like protein, putative [Plasmodium berghei]|eukprot:XP_034420867.1 BEM46-like protein, putative [Plasmodium berghei ANKA]
MVLKQVIISIIVAVIASIALINTYIYFSQDNLIFVKKDIDPIYNKPLGDNYEEVMIKTEDGHQNKCWFIKAKDYESKPVILYFLGNGSYVEKNVNIFNLMVGRVDVSIFSCSNRGTGDNTLSPSEAAFYKDAQSYLNYLKMKNMKNIFLFGTSMGCAVAIETAMNNPNSISGLIVQNPFLSMKEMAKLAKPFLFFIILSYDLIIRTKMNNEEKIKKNRVPILFNISEKDKIVPPEHGKKLHEICPSKKFIYTAKDGEHNDILVNDDGSYHRSMKIFIETVNSTYSKK